MSTVLTTVTLVTVLSTGAALVCYDSSYPKAHKKTECGPDMMCYSEYYAVNRSGTVRQYYDRFCVHKSHCLYRGINEDCPSLEQLDHKMQGIFTKHHAKSNLHTIKHSEFCCCSTDLCNNIDHTRVQTKYGIELTSRSHKHLFWASLGILLLFHI